MSLATVDFAESLRDEMRRDPVQHFLADLRRLNRSRATIRRRQLVLRRFETWAEARGVGLLEVEAVVVDAWAMSLTVSGPSLRHYLTDLTQFYRWAHRVDLVTKDPTALLTKPKDKRGLPRPIPDADLAHAIAHASPKMRRAMLLAAYAGLRAAEIARIHTDDVDLADSIIIVRDGKGSKDRAVPLHPDLVAEIADLPRGPVIAQADGRAYAEQSISALGHAEFARLGISSSLHKLRHWYATKLYRSTKDLRLVQELLGHASPSTTAIYAAADPSTAGPAVAALRIGD